MDDHKKIKETRNKEIEYVHDQKPSSKLVRDSDVMEKIILSQSSTYTDLYAFVNDYEKFCNEQMIDNDTYCLALNDIYLLALILMSDEEYKEKRKELYE